MGWMHLYTNTLNTWVRRTTTAASMRLLEAQIYDKEKLGVSKCWAPHRIRGLRLKEPVLCLMNRVTRRSCIWGSPKIGDPNIVP